MTENGTNLMKDINLQVQEVLWPIKQDKLKEHRLRYSIINWWKPKIKERSWKQPEKSDTSYREWLEWLWIPHQNLQKTKDSRTTFCTQCRYSLGMTAKQRHSQMKEDREFVASALAQKQILKEVLQAEGKWYHRATWYCRNSFRNEGRTIEGVYIWLNILDYFLNFSKIWILLKEKNYSIVW